MSINTPIFITKGKQWLVDYCKNIFDRGKFKIIQLHANILNFAACICKKTFPTFKPNHD